jgi:hypothetical protein
VNASSCVNYINLFIETVTTRFNEITFTLNVFTWWWLHEKPKHVVSTTWTYKCNFIKSLCCDGLNKEVYIHLVGFLRRSIAPHLHTTQTQKNHMHRVGFAPMIPILERPKAFRVLDLTARQLFHLHNVRSYYLEAEAPTSYHTFTPICISNRHHPKYFYCNFLVNSSFMKMHLFLWNNLFRFPIYGIMIFPGATPTTFQFPNP